MDELRQELQAKLDSKADRDSVNQMLGTKAAGQEVSDAVEVLRQRIELLASAAASRKRQRPDGSSKSAQQVLRGFKFDTEAGQLQASACMWDRS